MSELSAERRRPMRCRTLRLARNAAFVVLAAGAFLAIVLLAGSVLFQPRAACAQDEEEPDLSSPEKLAREFTDSRRSPIGPCDAKDRKQSNV